MLEPVVWSIAERITFIDLSRIRGQQAVIARVPSEAGIYAWFYNYLPPDVDSTSASEFADYLLHEATRPHCVPRFGKLPPLYEVELRSKKDFSRAKRESLLRLCEGRRFRSGISQILKSAIFFQQPLYVGKAAHLPTRISNHLSPGSKLRTRLARVSIDLDSAMLACMSVAGGVDGDREDDRTNAPEPSEEEVLEDLFSKLFHPLFTIRYG